MRVLFWEKRHVGVEIKLPQRIDEEHVGFSYGIPGYSVQIVDSKTVRIYSLFGKFAEAVEYFWSDLGPAIGCDGRDARDTSNTRITRITRITSNC